jgi:hypothetical protein
MEYRRSDGIGLVLSQQVNEDISIWRGKLDP